MAAADILGLNFLDHLIFSETCYFSFRQEGYIGDKADDRQDEDTGRFRDVKPIIMSKRKELP